MLPKVLCVVMLVLLVALVVAAPAFAAPNPNGTGQPSQSCGSATASKSPNGFNSSGFAHAETVYAGSRAGMPAKASSHAVSQYDVACYQVTQNHR